MAGAKNHQYHILDPDIWPLVGAFSGLTFTSGMVLFMHEMSGAHLVLGLGIAGLIATFWGWFSKIVNEAQRGDHTPVVQLHLRYGMILFIASEVLDAFDLPLLNTLILLCSGTTVTWAHHSLIHGDREGLKKGLWATILLGLLFSMIQAIEYSHASFGFGGSAYSSAFYMATGFHGFHVLIGTIFLMVCLGRVYKGHFTPRQHFGFEAAAWYWHFVDVVWLFLFVSVYVWGGWGAPIH